MTTPSINAEGPQPLTNRAHVLRYLSELDETVEFPVESIRIFLGHGAHLHGVAQIDQTPVDCLLDAVLKIGRQFAAAHPNCGLTMVVVSHYMPSESCLQFARGDLAEVNVVLFDWLHVDMYGVYSSVDPKAIYLDEMRRRANGPLN